MPTIASSVIPIPKSWDEFEDITLSAMKIRWTSPNLTRHGRQGQKQDGVDIFGEDDLGRNVGVQCKLTQAETVNIDLIKAEIDKAENFRPSLSAYFIAVSISSDANLQKQVRLLSKERVEQGRFPVGILFWDDIIQDLKRDKSVFKLHYPELLIDGANIPETTRAKGNRLYSLLDLGYYGVHLEDWIGLLFGEFMDHLRASRDFNRLITNLEESTKVIFEADRATGIVGLLRELRDYVNSILENTEQTCDWRPVNELSVKIISQLESLDYQLEGRELITFKIGHGIAIWDFYGTNTGKDYSKERLRVLMDYISRISPEGKIPNYILDPVEAYNDDDADFVAKAGAPDKVYAGVRRLLLD